MDRCDGCGALQVTHPDTYDVEHRLAALGYVATDVYHDHDDGQTYHGHALDDDRNDHDGYGEVLQNHDDQDAHDLARQGLVEAGPVCPRHWELGTVEFTKSVAPTGRPDQLLIAQGKCERCECIQTVAVRTE